MNTHLHGADGLRRVHVVGRRNRHRVNLEFRLVVKHLAVIRVERHLGEHIDQTQFFHHLVGEHCGALIGVGVAECHELDHARLHHRHPVGKALAHDADRRKTDLAAALAPAAASSHRAERGNAADSAQEIPS